jgi:tRNA threonylcarbamoyladenosine biosynthesis protein TsaB
MNILSIETSSSAAGAAVFAENALRCETFLDHRLTHSQFIMPLVERVMEESSLELAQLDCLAVNVGPGSFTGVRIGVCAANALAAALKKPVAAVDSLAVLAANAPGHSLVCPLYDARGEQVYAGLFDTSSSIPRPLLPLFAGSVHEFLPALPTDKPILFLGDGAQAHESLLKERFGDCCRFFPAHLNRPRAGALAFLGADLLEKGQTVQEAVPLYLRPSQAERMAAKNV